VLEVDDANDPNHDAPPSAKWYVASIFVGRSYEVIFEGDQQSFHAGVKAKLMKWGGSVDAAQQQLGIRAQVRARGLTTKTKGAIFLTSVDQIDSAYEQGSPVPFWVEYRRIPGRPVKLPQKLEWKADAEKIQVISTQCGGVRAIIGLDTGKVTCRLQNPRSKPAAAHVVGVFQSDNLPRVTGSTDVALPGLGSRDVTVDVPKVDFGRMQHATCSCQVQSGD
jgi:hypothetical protein